MYICLSLGGVQCIPNRYCLLSFRIDMFSEPSLIFLLRNHHFKSSHQRQHERTNKPTCWQLPTTSTVPKYLHSIAFTWSLTGHVYSKYKTISKFWALTYNSPNYIQFPKQKNIWLLETRTLSLDFLYWFNTK